VVGAVGFSLRRTRDAVAPEIGFGMLGHAPVILAIGMVAVAASLPFLVKD